MPKTIQQRIELALQGIPINKFKLDLHTAICDLNVAKGQLFVLREELIDSAKLLEKTKHKGIADRLTGLAEMIGEPKD